MSDWQPNKNDEVDMMMYRMARRLGTWLSDYEAQAWRDEIEAHLGRRRFLAKWLPELPFWKTVERMRKAG